MSADFQAKTIKPMGIQGGIDATDVLGAMGAMLGAAGLGVIWCVSIHSFPPQPTAAAKDSEHTIFAHCSKLVFRPVLGVWRTPHSPRQ